MYLFWISIIIWWIRLQNLFYYCLPHFHVLDEKRILHVALAHLQGQLGLSAWRIANHGGGSWSDGGGERLFESDFFIIYGWRYYTQTSMIFRFVEFFGHNVRLRIFEQACVLEVVSLIGCVVLLFGYIDIMRNQVDDAKRYSRCLWLSEVVFWIWSFGYLL